MRKSKKSEELRKASIDERKQVFKDFTGYRVSPGEYYKKSNSDTDPTVHAARERLLLSIAEHTPEVLEALERDVLPAYHAYVHSRIQAGENVEYWHPSPYNLLMDIPAPNDDIRHLLPEGYEDWARESPIPNEPTSASPTAKPMIQ